jgi:hypothetical protein
MKYIRQMMDSTQRLAWLRISFTFPSHNYRS